MENKGDYLREKIQERMKVEGNKVNRRRKGIPVQGRVECENEVMCVCFVWNNILNPVLILSWILSSLFGSNSISLFVSIFIQLFGSALIWLFGSELSWLFWFCFILIIRSRISLTIRFYFILIIRICIVYGKLSRYSRNARSRSFRACFLCWVRRRRAAH